MPDPVSAQGRYRSVRWSRIEEMDGILASDDDAVEILRDLPGSQFSRITLGSVRGSGTMEYLCEDEVRVLLLDCKFNRGLNVIVDDEGWVRLNFSPRIDIDMAIGEKVSVRENEPSWRIFRLAPDQTTVEDVPAASPVRWITLCCRPEWLARLAGMEVDDLPFPEPGGDDESLIYRHYNFTRSLLAVTNELFERPQSQCLRAAFVSAKAAELAILAMDYLLNNQSVAQFVGLRLSQRDIEIIDEVHEYLSRNFAGASTVTALSRKMGINRNKLFYGFKSRFGVTISEQIAEARLKEGARLLQETDESLANIAAAIGFRHQCNFSTAFRRRYGVPPRSIRNRLTAHQGKST